MRRRYASGFTLVELMITVLILAVTLAIGIPNFRTTMQSNRVATTSNELMGSIAYARGDAITTTRRAGICPANAAGTDCDGSATDWGTNGWLIWRDNTADAGYQAGTDDLLRVVQGRPGMTVTVPVSTNVAIGNTLVFDSRGRAMGITAGTPRTIVMRPASCISGAPYVRNMALTALGQVSVTKDNCT